MTEMATLDFIRALNERPFLVKLLFRLFVGRYAYREFLFMVRICDERGYAPFGDYGLQNNQYHKAKQPWRWWLKGNPPQRDQS